MATTKDRKSNAIKLIEIINNIIFMLEKLVAIKSKSKEEVDGYYNEFLKDMGAIESISKFYFSEKVNVFTKSFISNCDSVYLIIEIKLNMQEIERVNELIEEEAREIARLESKEEELGEESITIEKVKLLIAEKSEISNRKLSLEMLKKQTEKLHTKIIENKYRIRKVYSVDSEEGILDEAKSVKNTLINSIESDYKLNNRILKVF
ncbi:hypothetical protein QIX46_00475 [Lysinibacillus boronitolerans]|nr:hypothetical protein QIX46_00475 [Lysinibacillus boronitolerans]